MGWLIEKNQLVYKRKNDTIFPSAEEIYKLSRGEESLTFPDITRLPSEDLDIRFSKLGATTHIDIDFLEAHNNIDLKIFACRKNKKVDILYKDGKLPDSIVIENTWYNLLHDHDDVVKILTESEIYNEGNISLSQYIALKKKLSHYKELKYQDNAEAALSNHPMQDQTKSMPISLKAKLYPYQQHGYQWMRFVTDEQCGCILGDEMGLGKTLQIIALIAGRKQAGHLPTLVIVPVSLLENWRREFEKFTSDIKVFVHHGSKRTGLYTELLDYDVIIISYNTACSDQSLLKMISWDLVVVDEAQNIKNPSAIRTKSIKNIPRKIAIALTGTPFENHITDIWSLMDFVAPGCFGKVSEFERDYTDDLDGARLLEPVLTPIMIRRRVKEVAQDLPVRIDVPQILQMTSEEIYAYEGIREKILDDFNGENATLPMLQKLRMYCTHPILLNAENSDNPIIGSSKYERLCELLEEIILLEEKVILFTSYNGMFEILEKDIPKRFGIQVMAINGSTSSEERQPIIDRFSDILGTALLVLNPRAAGTGLNITAANRVIHYNLEWNPSLEDQASARAYRRGQTRTVFVYRLYYKDTVEEIINDRIDKKREMFNAAIVGTDGTKENNADILRALMISPGGNEYE